MAQIPPEPAIKLWPDPESGPWRLELRFELMEGRWECVGLSVYREPSLDQPRILTTSELRSIPLGRLVAEYRQVMSGFMKAGAGVAGYTGDLTVKFAEAYLELGADAWLESHSIFPKRTGRPAYWTNQRLAEVARVYAEAWQTGRNPTGAVAQHFHKTTSTAAKLVAMCRRTKPEPLLPPTKPGKQGWLTAEPAQKVEASEDQRKPKSEHQGRR